MIDLKEIEARLAEPYIGRGGQLFTSEEVRPLVTEVKRLKGLCGRAEALFPDWDKDDGSGRATWNPEVKVLLAELKEANHDCGV